MRTKLTGAAPLAVKFEAKKSLAAWILIEQPQKASSRDISTSSTFSGCLTSFFGLPFKGVCYNIGQFSCTVFKALIFTLSLWFCSVPNGSGVSHSAECWQGHLQSDLPWLWIFRERPLLSFWGLQAGHCRASLESQVSLGHDLIQNQNLCCPGMLLSSKCAL